MKDSHNVQNNLLSTQSRFSRFFSQVRARFNRKGKVTDNTQSLDYKKSQGKPKVQERQMPQQEVEQNQENIQ